MSTLAPVRSFSLYSLEGPRSSHWALVRAWLPTFVWIAVIAFESSSIFTSDHTQGWIHAVLNLVSSKLAAHSELINAAGRKLGHFSGYSILSFLSFFGWTELLAYRKEKRLAAKHKQVRVPRRWHLRAAVLGVLVTFAVACCDEFHQAFIPGRTGVFHDVLLDCMGGVFAQIVILLWWNGRRKDVRVPELEMVSK
jgi:VanZ family protein